MTRGVAHSPEKRAQVVAAVHAGTSITEVARQYGLDKGLVSRWVKADQLVVATDATEKEVALYDLICEYLAVGLLAMISQAEVMSDPDYVRSQDADKLAIAHGVLGDKLAVLARTSQALGVTGQALPSPDNRNGTRVNVETVELPKPTG